jgi:flagellar biogenesis protein FliO
MKNIPIKAGCLLFTFCFLPAALADGANAAISPALSAPEAGVSLLRVTGALILVIGLFLGGVWIFRNWQRLAVRHGRPRKLDVMEVRPLGGRQAIYVVAYEQERFLLASSPAGVNFLTHLPGAAGEEENAPETKPVIPFSQALARVLRGK